MKIIDLMSDYDSDDEREKGPTRLSRKRPSTANSNCPRLSSPSGIKRICQEDSYTERKANTFPDPPTIPPAIYNSVGRKMFHNRQADEKLSEIRGLVQRGIKILQEAINLIGETGMEKELEQLFEPTPIDVEADYHKDPPDDEQVMMVFATSSHHTPFPVHPPPLSQL